MIGVLFAVAMAAVFLGVGRWGRRNAESLVPDIYSATTQQAKVRSLRRGAITCLITGSLFLAFALLQAVDLVLGH